MSDLLKTVKELRDKYWKWDDYWDRLTDKAIADYYHINLAPQQLQHEIASAERRMNELKQELKRRGEDVFYPRPATDESEGA